MPSATKISIYYRTVTLLLFVLVSIIGSTYPMNIVLAAAANVSRNNAALQVTEDVHRVDRIRVSFYALDGYHELDKDGNKCGFGYDFLQLTQRYASFKYEYVGYDRSWSQTMKMLEAGEIDMVTSAHKNAARTKQFDFSRPIGTSCMNITTRIDEDRYVAGDFSTYKGMRIGLLQGSASKNKLAAFADANGFSYVPAYYRDNSALESALQNKEIDAICTSSLRRMGNEAVLNTFATEYFYAIVKKGNTRLLNKINYAIAQMDINEGDWRGQLYYKNYMSTGSAKLRFTPAELQYIKEHSQGGKKVVLATDPEWIPFSFYNNGAFEGIIPDYWNNIMKLAGMDYEYYKDNTQFNDHKVLKDKKIDLYLGYSLNNNEAEKHGLVTSPPYMNVSISHIHRRDSKGREIIALAKTTPLLNSTIKLKDGQKPVIVANTDVAIAMVKDGKADIAYVYTIDAERIINRDTSSTLESHVEPGVKFCLQAVIPEEKDHVLMSIVSKCIRATDPKFIDSLVYKHISYGAGKLTLRVWVNMHPVATALALLALVGAAGGAWAINQRTKNRLKLEEEKRKMESAMLAKETALVGKLQDSLSENEAQLEKINSLNAQLQNNQSELEELTAEQKSQIEEITSLNNQLQDNQARLEESAAENEAQLEEISQLNDKMSENLSIIFSMSKVYFAAYYVDLASDRYIELSTIDTIHNTVIKEQSFLKAINDICDHLIMPEFRESMRRFADLNTINDRLKDVNFITEDYKGITSGWSKAYIIAADRDEQGHVKHIFFNARTIHDEKAREEKWQKEIITQYEMINAAGKVYNCIYYIDLQDYSYVEVSTKSSKFAKVGEYIAAKGNAEESLEMFLKHLILPEYEAKLREFCDLSTLDERLIGKTFITCDFKGVVNGYSQGVFIAGDRDEKGKLRHVYWAVRDNNEIKNRELAHEKELEKAIDAAEAANKAKTVFLNNMSHDIRTPMNAILGFAKLMEKELDKPELAREHLKKIHYSGEYLLTIINNILDMARIESGRTTVDEELIDLAEAQGGVVAVFEEVVKKKNISLNCSWDIQHRYVYVDYAKCQQIAVNLISNAIKYTPSGGSVTVRVDELPSERQGYTDFRLTVQDTGIGMSKEFQEELFEAFSRERNTTHSKVVGTGLGMAIVKKLVDMMQGTVFVDSEPGKGSTFKVRVSLRIAEAPRMYISRQEEVAPLAIDLSGKRILLAEDNELNAEIATCILEDEGFIVEHAEDGIACVDMVNKKAAGYYDVILMDIQMPNLNGYGATEKIRKFADKAKAIIPIIAMTANAFDEDKKRALDVGMDGFCTKPIEVEQLIKELARVLAGGK